VAGLNLRGGAGVQAALPASSSDGTIAGLAYGAGASGTVSSNQRPVAGLGTIGVTVVCAGILAWMWWTLPQ
jgi:hypothetical protein